MWCGYGRTLKKYCPRYFSSSVLLMNCLHASSALCLTWQFSAETTFRRYGIFPASNPCWFPIENFTIFCGGTTFMNAFFFCLLILVKATTCFFEYANAFLIAILFYLQFA